jgi:hypothetical protein
LVKCGASRNLGTAAVAVAAPAEAQRRSESETRRSVERDMF